VSLFTFLFQTTDSQTRFNSVAVNGAARQQVDRKPGMPCPKDPRCRIDIEFASSLS
jgi:hypothetical protein